MRKILAILVLAITGCAVGEISDSESGGKVCTEVVASVDDTCDEVSDSPEAEALVTYCSATDKTCPTGSICKQGVNGYGQIQWVCVPTFRR